MKVLGIIVEYNPFHNGHLYHLKKSCQLIKPDYTVAIMSGHFTQRGEAAIVDKWKRTEMALSNGIDLVLELPTVYATQTAELFAFGGIQLLNHMGLITHVSFGSEIGELGPLMRISKILADEPVPFSALLKEYLNQGLSFPQARFKALIEYVKKHEQFMFPEKHWKKIIVSPNSILALEYLKALYRTNSTIIPVTFPRVGACYSSQKMVEGLSSAASIRSELLKHGCAHKIAQSMPLYSFEILKDAVNVGMGPVSNKSLEQLFLGIIRRATLNEISSWMDVEEGLENRIKDCSLKATSLQEFLGLAKTKRYVYTRLQRILIHGLLGITKEKMSKFHSLGGPQYLRILGFAKKARPLLKQLKTTSHVPIITKAAHYYQRLENPVAREMFEIDTLATDLYCLGLPKNQYNRGTRDFTERIRMV
jgi:predicted nucleotidyltransferase